MDLEALVARAAREGASDLHLEPGAPATWRVRGRLVFRGEPMRGEDLAAMASRLVDSPDDFERQGSADLSCTLSGVRCRVHVLRSSRGIGLAVRILREVQPTLASLNLHRDLARLVHHDNGLVLVAGATGSGKSSTLAALIHEINRSESRHIVTIERPIEFAFRNRCSIIRQREVERDTPSFDQGLRDSLREDPDVLMVGEMRRPSTMQLTINAAESGHLVLATVHSGSCAEALQRIVHAMPADSQANVRAQLADTVRAVVNQTLVYREDLEMLVPELEVLVVNRAARSHIRQGDFFKLGWVLETGSRDGSWTRERYREWMKARESWHAADLPSDADAETSILSEVEAETAAGPSPGTPVDPPAADDVIVLDSPTDSVEDILSELEDDQER